MTKNLKTILIITGTACVLLITLSLVFYMVVLPIRKENKQISLEKQQVEKIKAEQEAKADSRARTEELNRQQEIEKKKSMTQEEYIADCVKRSFFGNGIGRDVVVVNNREMTTSEYCLYKFQSKDIDINLPGLTTD